MTKKGEIYGKLVESFVYSELLKHQAFSDKDINIYHYRDVQKREVDFVLESTDGKIVALEIKSGSNIKKDDFKGLLILARTIEQKRFRE